MHKDQQEINKPAKDLDKKEKKKEDAIIDEASMESFPASDPPAWTGGVDHKDKN